MAPSEICTKNDIRLHRDGCLSIFKNQSAIGKNKKEVAKIVQRTLLRNKTL